MACVILPSETARLVYGYLVKENLNEIALQFLEVSPYLTDCCQIIKSGYQFNTKLMGKELQDLLQEYSVIHNLISKKVSLLSKTSLLYKRIKLRCESLSEILELILFWKYRNLKNEENSINCEKIENSTNSFLCRNNSEFKSNCNDAINNDVRNLNIGSNNNSFYNASNDANILQNNENSASENFHTKLTNETFVKSKNLIDNEISEVSRSERLVLEHDTNQEKNSVCTPMQISDISQEFKKSASEKNIGSVNNGSNSTDNTVNCNIPLHHDSNDSPMSELCLNSNILTMEINPQRKNLVSNEVGNMALQSNEGTVEYDSQIKVVRIEKENLNENHAVDVYSASTRQNEENIALENGSVVYVSPEVGDVAIDQGRNQIIVIPIDYYKSQNDFQNRIEVETGHKEDFFHSKEIIVQDKNEVIFEDVQVAGGSANSMTQFYNEEINKPTSVDDNIMTERDFLKNKDLMYNLEKELIKPQVQTQPPQEVPKNVKENVFLPPAATPVIVLSQGIIPSKPRFRSILPKRKKISPVPPVVVVQPLLESNQGITRKLPNRAKAAKKDVTKKLKKKVPLVQKSKNNEVESSENLNMPMIKTPVPDKSFDKTNSDESLIITETAEKSTESPEVTVANEEKENLEKSESKKTETPVFVTRRNFKRQSLSTPRRRSHIRALEFETPPKKKGEKKSRTSPKAKVGQVTVERKSVRNTLFKSPIPEDSFKSVEAVKEHEIAPCTNQKVQQESGVEPLNELSIPIATRSPNTRLSDAWESLTGVGCVIGQTERSDSSPPKKMWDADLRCFISDNNLGVEPLEKKRIRKTEKTQKDNRKSIRKKAVVAKKSKPITPTTVSPSKMSLTAKRNTYCINGNEESSPIRSLLDDLKMVTPFKDIETIRPTEETPLTKLLRENINSIDIDLSMINTPSFPPTPSIVITPDLDDISLISGTNYYSPSKDFSKEKVVKITDYFRVDAEKSADKDATKENHEKVIGDLVSKAREIIGIGKESPEDSASKNRPSGKILSMVKIQMLTQCDKKLCENIPINEEGNFSSNSSHPAGEEPTKSDLKEELEEKRKRALKKIKENLSPVKSKMVRQQKGRKRKRSGGGSTNGSHKKGHKSRSDASREREEGAGEKSSSWSEESDHRKETELFHSTPKKSEKKLEKSDSEKKILCSENFLSEIRREFPPFQNFKDRCGELNEKSRKKIYYVEQFLKLADVVRFMEEFRESDPPRLQLKPSFGMFFRVFHKWLKHPHKRELNASEETKALLQKYLTDFDKISMGLSRGRSKRPRKNSGLFGQSSSRRSSDSKGSPDRSKGSRNRGSRLSDEDEKEWKGTGGSDRKKEEEAEDGSVSILPLKKRKSTVQQVEVKRATAAADKNDGKNLCTDNVTQTQNFLQDIDVDRFLFQIHGQGNR